VQIKELCSELNLIAPSYFWSMDEATLALLTGGCGPGGVGDWFVPDTVYGLCVTAACIVHDFQYAVGTTAWEKNEADEVFLDNLRWIVDQEGGFLRRLRRARIYVYYFMVSKFGKKAFESTAFIV